MFLSIEEFIVPSHVKYIGQFCFESCFSLNKFEFSKDLNFLYFKNKNSIKSQKNKKVFIPRFVLILRQLSFQMILNLNQLELTHLLIRLYKKLKFHLMLKKLEVQHSLAVILKKSIFQRIQNFV